MKREDNNGRSIRLRGIRKSWGDATAVDKVDLDVAPGTFTVLLGPSGCGKSTSLRIIAGLESADHGSIEIGGVDVTDQAPSKRDIAMVFQSYALFPHLSVAENILFGLKVRRTGRVEQQQRLQKTVDMLGLSGLLTRKPSELSGGQQQRVALGRAIIAEKPVCLMDEPLSNLDAKLRHTMRTEIRDLQQSLGFSMVYVTHDQSEAITMADQVVLMREGKIEQCGTPREIYEQPASAFVAGFIGTPPMNLIPASAFPVASTVANELVENELKNLIIGVRPEHVRVTNEGGVDAIVRHIEYLGADVLADCEIGHSSLQARLPGSSAVRAGERVSLGWDAGFSHFFETSSGKKRDVESSLLCGFINI